MAKLIDADETVKAIINRLGIGNERYLLPSERAIVDVIESMPAIDTKPVRHAKLFVKGRWLKTNIHSTFGDKPALFYCSECNMCVPFPTPYCPFCGTSMLGERRYDGDTKC